MEWAELLCIKCCGIINSKGGKYLIEGVQAVFNQFSKITFYEFYLKLIK